MELLHSAEHIFHLLVEFGILILEGMGVGVLIVTACKSMIQYFHHDEQVKVKLAQGIALGLEFKLGGEVLRTVIVRDWNELGILAVIILLRGALTLILHWEIRD